MDKCEFIHYNTGVCCNPEITCKHHDGDLCVIAYKWDEIDQYKERWQRIIKGYKIVRFEEMII